MNATVAHVITIGSLAAIIAGYQGNYLIGILGGIVYIIAVLCALATAAMRGDTAMLLCIIFVPVIGLFCAIAKYCNSEGNISATSEERLVGLLVGGPLALGGCCLFYNIAKISSVVVVIFVSIIGMLMVLAGVCLILGAIKSK